MVASLIGLYIKKKNYIGIFLMPLETYYLGFQIPLIGDVSVFKKNTYELSLVYGFLMHQTNSLLPAAE